MPIRNPFARRPGGVPFPPQEVDAAHDGHAPPAFEKVDTMGSRSALSIDSRRSQDVGEYKMSVVNDSGVYLPPSPTEKTNIWPRRSNPSTSSAGTNSLAEAEPFSISRESFDSYRRSFDISARSPIPYADGRQSLDSARLPRYPRASMQERRLEPAEEGFEDVGLHDDHVPTKPRKNRFFKFGDNENESPNQSTSRFHIMGRKRGQSGQGSELGNWKQADQEVEEIH